jgi:hypothetical protein
MPRKLGGGVAIVIAVLLYAWSVLDSLDIEPLLMLGVLLLVPLGIYLTARSSAVAPDEHPLQVRLNGPGEPGSLKREAWAHAQLRRGRSIRTAVLSLLITAVALFVANHATGSIGCDFQRKLPPLTCKSNLDWKTHADRQGKGATYLTKEGDSLASIALSHDIAPALLGPANPGAVLSVELEGPLAQALEETKAGKITIEHAARRLVLTPAEVASRFAPALVEAKQSLNIPAEPPYDPRQWFDWLLWTLAGVSAYLLIEIARNLREIPKGEGDFLAETSWYWTQIATGPLIAFVILLLFTHVDVDLLTGDEAAVEVNLHGYPMDLLIVPAFLLGFYSRVTRELLDQITRTVFRGAWRAAYGGFQVLVKGQTDDEVSSSVMFQAEPATTVAWSATLGTIDAGGVYQPPSVSAPTRVFVTAVAPSSGQAATREITVVKHRFEVQTASTDKKLPQGKPLKLSVQPPVAAPDDALVAWDVVEPKDKIGVTLAPATGNETEVKADASLVGKTVTVQATYAGLSRKIDLIVV